jgi:dihydrodiol dehydrogenase / D-xylose 1-dehydrogenase (NADP)
MSVRWGILTCGKISNDFVNALTNTPNAQVVACAARSLESAKKFSKTHNIPVAYGSYEELVKDKNVDIVYIGSLHNAHYEHTMLALNHGKHVLVEKPAGMNLKEVQAMYKLAAEKNLYLMEGLWTVFFPAFQKVQELINNGTIGDVNFVEVDFGVAFPPTVDRIWKPELAGGGLLDIGVYSVGLVTMLINGGKERPSEIKALGVVENGVDVVGSATMKYKDNKIAVAKWNCRGSSPGEIVAVGNKGYIRVLGPFHHPINVVVHNLLEGPGGRTETHQYYFPFPAPKHLNSPMNFTGSIGFTYEATAVQNDILQKKQFNSTYTPTASMIVSGILEEVRRQIGLVYPGEKSKL